VSSTRAATNGWRYAVLVGAAAAQLRCGPPPAVILADPGRNAPPEQYEAMVDRWTRDSEVLDWGAGFESRLTVSATYFSKEFRRAYLSRLTTVASIPQAERDRMFGASLRAADVEHEFFVALAPQQPRWGDLDRATSAWRVRLVDDQGREHAPSRVERFRQATPLDRAMFHYWSPWRVVFRIRFPALDADGTRILRENSRHFLLRFGGPYGTADLRWVVRAP